jgi:hypothetical protein
MHITPFLPPDAIAIRAMGSMQRRGLDRTRCKAHNIPALHTGPNAGREGGEAFLSCLGGLVVRVSRYPAMRVVCSGALSEKKDVWDG